MLAAVAVASHTPTHRAESIARAKEDLEVALRLATALARRAPSHARDDARGEALLTWSALRDRHDPGRASMSTFAYQRMRGSTIDLLRRDNHPQHRSARPVLSADLVASSSVTVKLALRQALVAAEPTLDPLERTVLDLVYSQGLNVAEASQRSGYTGDRLARANQRLLARLRQRMQVDVG